MLNVKKINEGLDKDKGGNLRGNTTSSHLIQNLGLQEISECDEQSKNVKKSYEMRVLR